MSDFGEVELQTAGGQRSDRRDKCCSVGLVEPSGQMNK